MVSNLINNIRTDNIHFNTQSHVHDNPNISILGALHAMSNMMNSIGQDFPEDVKRVSTQEELDKFKIITYESFKNTGLCKIDECNICLENYENIDELMVLKCDHYFHKKCITPWLSENSNKCPICKISVSEGMKINI